ncbi:MAG TPA: hypothetical protein PKG95_11150, partial [Anaerolineaceae bacterium]|nr:hypothetical protein [Anaerolineaceae bacterium]
VHPLGPEVTLAAPFYPLDAAPTVFRAWRDFMATMPDEVASLFLMWNVPYGVALAHPVRWRVSLYEALAMQAIGLIGESLLLASFPAGHPVIAASVSRFILFDGIGLAALLGALLLTSARRGQSLA